jgi:hypothetical protein
MQQLTNANQVEKVFGALLKGVRACAPKCSTCQQPLGDEQTTVHAVDQEDGTRARICHPCFVEDLAEALVNNSPAFA